jgi:hypothetical protein
VVPVAEAGQRDEAAAVAVDIVPIEIEVVTVPHVPAVEERNRSGSRSGSGNGSGRREGNGEGQGQGATGTGMLSMRGARKGSAIAGADLGAIAEVGEVAAVVPPSGMVVPNGTAGMRIDDGVTTVQIHPDGSVDFHDKPSLTYEWLNPLLSPKGLRDPGKAVKQIGRDIGNALEAWSRDPYAQTKDTPRDDRPALAFAVDPELDHGGGAGVDVDTGGVGATLPILGGNLDLGGWAERLAGNDPYAARKRKLLDATFAERAEIGTVHRAAQRDRATELVRKNLERLWRATTDPALRRAALFEMWNECDESEGLDGEAGARARAQIVGWIRSHLPAGTPEAYSADELAQLDRRRSSRQHFRPYDP